MVSSAPRARLLRPLALLLLAGSASSFAHVTLEYQVAMAGASYKASFRVGHGCGASPTRQVSVAIPAGVTGARPMPKPGWTLELQREKLPRPVSSHGRTVTEDVVRVTWTARGREDMLDSRHYDEFALVAQMPQQAGRLYWPVSQVCEEGRSDWTELPAAGQPHDALKSPAALLDVLPATGGGEHKH